MRVLSGHTTPDTAYVVEDYPFGFRLRCKIRYWLEYAPKKGFRLWSQTTNPKRAGEVWNKPKASTFQRFAGAMYLNEAGHVAWTGLTEYNSVQDCVNWREQFGSTMPEKAQEFLKMWITRKLSFEQAMVEGQVTSTITTTHYGSITAPGFGKPISEPTVEKTVLKSQYTAAELAAMGGSLRTPAAAGMAGLTGESEAA